MTDIRRTIRMQRPVTGRELVQALQQLVAKYNERINCREYVEHTVRDIDGQKTVSIGIASNYPYEDILLCEGQDLGNTELNPNTAYERIGVRNTSFPGMKYAIGFADTAIVDAVERIRDDLERLLQKEETQ